MRHLTIAVVLLVGAACNSASPDRASQPVDAVELPDLAAGDAEPADIYSPAPDTDRDTGRIPDEGGRSLTVEAVIERGSLPVGRRSFEWVDGSRTTPAHGEQPELPQRTLEVDVWYPAEGDAGAEDISDAPLEKAGAPYPLVVYSHGFMSQKSENERLYRYLASHGMLVAAIGYPLSGMSAPGGPTIIDIGNMPGDISFVIDTLADMAGEEPLSGAADTSRVALAGLSFGGLTSFVATFHPDYADPRVTALVSIAGGVCMVPDSVFVPDPRPKLFLHGDKDVIAPYSENGLLSYERSHAPKVLATLHGGTHLAFANNVAPLFGELGNPDLVGCASLSEHTSTPDSMTFAAALGYAADATNEVACPMPCTEEPPEETMVVARQADLLVAAVGSFLRGALCGDAAMAAYLAGAFDEANEDVTVQSEAAGR